MFVERADRIRRRTAGGSLTGILDGSEFSENSNASSTLNDETSSPLDTSDIHQKSKPSFIFSITKKNFSLNFSINVVKNE